MFEQTQDFQPAGAMPPSPPAIEPIVKPKTAEDEPDLPTIALDCAQQAKGDIQEGANLLLQKLRVKHPAFYADLAARALRSWAIEQIRCSAKSSRDHIKALAPQGDSVFTAESMARFTASWMAWQVLPGIELRDATRKHLTQASESYLKQARTNTARGNWLAAIGEKMPDDTKKVADVFTEKQVTELAKKFEVAK